MPAPKEYPEEFKGRAIRLVEEELADPDVEVSITAACRRVGQQLGINRDTLRGWDQAVADRRRVPARTLDR